MVKKFLWSSVFALLGLTTFPALRQLTAAPKAAELTPQLQSEIHKHIDRYMACTSPKTSRPSQRLVMWGDSLTDGTGLSVLEGNTVLDVTQRLLGDKRETFNQGLGGNLAWAIAARAGAVPVTVTLPGKVLPAQPASIEVSLSPPILDGAGTLQIPAVIAGVPGLLVRQNRPRTPYTFTRLRPGTTVRVAGPVPLQTDDYFTEGAVQIFWMGTNDLLSSPSTSPARMAQALNAVRRHLGSGRYLFLNLQPGSHTEPGISAALQSINRRMVQNYPRHVVDVHQLLTTFGNHQDGLVSPALLADDIHLNEAGYYLVGAAVAQAISCRGW